MENLTRFRWKHIVLLGACTLALSVSSVLGSGHPDLAPSPSSPSSPALHNNADLRVMSEASAFARADYRSSGNQRHAGPGTSMAAANNHPNVYHSIIDRTDLPPSRPRQAASSAIQTSAAATTADGDLHTAAGHHHGHAYGKYYEYRAVPKKKTWKFGYKRGNHKHTISRHEHGKAGKHPHFKTKVKWHDKKSKGKGIHLWDYNHHDKKHYHHG